ncbi:MAG: DoxX family protein [Candidatus ainarchaeum sp.]|jgi:uncharacterized membrane protein YphA (DoxX/SURF4 family)|nr:DoxX family protein [Candidatus ainarchaeum sp.]
MNANKQKKVNFLIKINTYFLAALMLYAGINKLFINGIDGVIGMLTNAGFFLPVFLAWVLVIAEIGSGIMLFTGFYKKYVVLVPAFIMLVITFTIAFGNWQSMIQHLLLASNYLLIGCISSK